MGLWDSLTGAASNIWSGLGGWSGVGNIANVVGTGYDIYSGIKSSQLAEQYANNQFASAAQQDAYAQALFDRQKSLYWPLEDLNTQYSIEDMKALRSAYQNQIAYQAQRMDEQLAQAQVLNPMIDDAEQNLIKTLLEDPTALTERLMNQATTDVSLAYGSQREQDLRAMGIAGINPNSGSYENYLSQMGTSEALAQSTGRTQAARQAEELSLSRQGQALNYAKGAQLPTYNVTGSVNSSSLLSGLGASSPTYGGLANMYNTNAQNSLNGAWYQLNQLSSGSINPGWSS